MLLTWAGQGLLPQTQTLITAMTTPPDGARTRLINRTIQQFVSSGVWDRCDFIYMLAAHDSQAARLNWKQPGTNTLTVVNSPTFTTDRGYTGDGVSAALETVPSFSLYTQNDSHLSVYGLTTSVNTSNDIAVTNITPGLRGSLRSRNGVSATVRVSSPSFTSPVTGGTVPYQLLGVRTNSTDQAIYINGAFDTTGAIASAAPSAVLYSVIGSTSLAQYSDRQVAAATIGASLSADQIASLYAAQLAYLQNLGAA